LLLILVLRGVGGRLIAAGTHLNPPHGGYSPAIRAL